VKAIVVDASVGVSWIFDLAMAQQLSVYDATYLELAQRHQYLLATRDEPLQAAARKVGVQLWE